MRLCMYVEACFLCIWCISQKHERWYWKCYMMRVNLPPQMYNNTLRIYLTLHFSSKVILCCLLEVFQSKLQQIHLKSRQLEQQIVQSAELKQFDSCLQCHVYCLHLVAMNSFERMYPNDKRQEESYNVLRTLRYPILIWQLFLHFENYQIISMHFLIHTSNG